MTPMFLLWFGLKDGCSPGFYIAHFQQRGFFSIFRKPVCDSVKQTDAQSSGHFWNDMLFICHQTRIIDSTPQTENGMCDWNCLCSNSDNSIFDALRTGSFCEKYLGLGEGNDTALPPFILPLQTVLTSSVDTLEEDVTREWLVVTPFFIPSPWKLREEKSGKLFPKNPVCPQILLSSQYPQWNPSFQRPCLEIYHCKSFTPRNENQSFSKWFYLGQHSVFSLYFFPLCSLVLFLMQGSKREAVWAWYLYHQSVS